MNEEMEMEMERKLKSMNGSIIINSDKNDINLKVFL